MTRVERDIASYRPRFEHETDYALIISLVKLTIMAETRQLLRIIITFFLIKI